MQRVERAVAVRAEGIGKNYDLRPVLVDISVNASQGEIIGLVGRNGSGKSTLLKILANVLERNAGEIRWTLDDEEIDADRLQPHIGYVAPYLHLYTEFTGHEHLKLLNELRGSRYVSDHSARLIERFGLRDRFDDRLAEYSSGMMQRAKFILALAHEPSFLFLDEPTTNLDEEGVAALYREIEIGRNGRVTIIASNDPLDIARCTTIVDVTRG